MSETLKAEQHLSEQRRLERLAREHHVHMSNLYNRHIRSIGQAPKSLPIRPCC